MNEYEILNEFIDGELPPEQETELFAALNSSEELRNLMKHTIALNKAAKSPAMLSRPSAETTKALFSNLGISFMPESEEQETSRNEDKKRRYFPMIASIAAAILAMLVITMSMQESARIKQPGKVLATNTFKAVYPVMSSSGIQAENQHVVPSDTVVRYVYIHKTKEAIENEIDNDNGKIIIETLASAGNISKLMNYAWSPAITSDNTQIKFNPLILPDNVRINQPTIDISLPQVANQDNTTTEKGSELGFTVEIRGSQNWLDPEPNIEPRHKALFNNNSLAVMYSFTDELALGTEIRQENFFQKYQGFDRFLATESIYEQQPNFTSGGMFVRYSNKSISFINPFVQVTGGANETGLIARGMAGLIIKPVNNISIIFGYEYSRLFYNYQSKEFNSDKKSFNYGISYSF